MPTCNSRFPIVPWLRRLDRHLLVAATAWLSRLISALAQLASVTILLDYLGTDQYAIFAVVSSLAGWFALSDFGVGSSLQNYLSEARAKGEDGEDWLVSALWIIGALLLVCGGLTVFAAGPLQAWLLDELARTALFTPPGYMLALLGLIYVFTALTSVAYRVYYAQQRGYLANLFQAVGPILSLLGLLAVRHVFQGASKLLLSLVTFAGAPAIMAGLASIDIFWRLRRNRVEWRKVRMVWGRATKFGLFAVMAATTLLVDYLVMSRLLPSIEITQYSIISRVFSLMFFIYGAVLWAVWPVCSEAYTRRDWATMDQIAKRYVVVGIGLVIVGTLAFACTAPWAMRYVFRQPDLALPISTILWFGVYYLVRVVCDTYAMLLQSFSRIGVFLRYVPVQAVLSVGAQYVFCKRFGLDGILMGLIVSFVCTVLWALPREYYAGDVRTRG